jgi:peptidoglycan hydrolase-like protein with peptidoglycan-binding domain
VSRSQWGARSAQGSMNSLSSTPKGSAIHWEGPEMGTQDHSKCDDTVRGIQNYHMDTKGWSDIAYNILVCTHGYQYEGRGKGKGSAANGTTQANYDWYAICALVGEGDPQPPELITGLQDAAASCRSWGASDGSVGHRDLTSTSCPGDELYKRVRNGEFKSGGSSGGGTTPPPKPPTTKAPTFPLPSGHYFGPKSGPAESHSGYYNNDDDKFRPWQAQMSARGWKITIDGYYGPQTEDVCRQFQSEKGLSVDGLIGTQTWSTAWTASVT